MFLDNAYIVNRAQNGPFDWRNSPLPVARLSSDFTGIQVDVFTDQDVFQVYSCSQQSGSSCLFLPSLGPPY
jgi:aldose 1-epimerase